MKPVLWNDNLAKTMSIEKKPTDNTSDNTSDNLPEYESYISNPAPEPKFRYEDEPKRWWQRGWGISLLGLLTLLAVGAYFLFGSNTASYKGKKGVKIPHGIGFNGTVTALQEAGILDGATSFTALASVTGWRRQLKGGYYEFKSGASNFEILNRIRTGKQTPIKLTIPSGVQPKRVAQILQDKLEIDPKDFYAALEDEAFLREIGTDKAHVFGYLMPETYFFNWQTKIRPIIRRIKQELRFRLRYPSVLDGISVPGKSGA